MADPSSSIPSLLAIETAGGVCGAALWLTGDFAAGENLETPHGHASHLAPMIKRVAAAAKFRLADLAMIGATVGPGGFTGIRAGVAMARGLALGARCQAFGVDAFQRLAHCSRRAHRLLSARNLVVVDSRRAELFCALLDQRLQFLEEPFLSDDPVSAARARGADIMISDSPSSIAWDWDSSRLWLEIPVAEAVGELILRESDSFRLAMTPRYLRAPETSRPRETQK
jgi:tRNA threonylcarbamoyladenosine biosynthesis protein TsaB